MIKSQPITTSVSLFVIILIGFLVVLIGFQNKRWEAGLIIKSDASVYYAYLPAAFIHQDLYFEYATDFPEIFGTTWRTRADNNNRVVKMSMGNAIMWTPFFGFASLYCLSTGQQPTGYSEPYHFFIFMASVFYLLLGLLFLRKLLLLFVNEIATSITMMVIVFGTNLLYYTAIESGMSHVNNFFLITTFFYLWIQWFKKPRITRSVFLGLTIGLITLIRPVNILVVLMPVFYWAFQKETWQYKITFLNQNLKHLLIIVVFSFLSFFPQLLYWKIVTDQWWFYSYMNERFFFNSPHIFDGLFSFRKGWLIYTPVMLLAFAGLFTMKNKATPFLWPLIITLTILIYVIFSWWCWWYGGSFGSRVMIDYYGLMALPMATFIQYCLSRPYWKKAIVGVLISFFILLNLFQMRQYVSSLLHYDSMSKELYLSIFLTQSRPDSYNEMLVKPDYAKALNGENESE
ncbi:MAG: hypothetical protein KKF98_12315 [Bacteroidetes bacterium]|nr:hypothetical protein [Bacteroidota bacterium]